MDDERLRATTDLSDPAAAPTAPLDDEAPLRAGALIGHFVVQRPLGAGGMGVVVEAHDPRLNRAVAIKLLRPAQDASVDTTRARDRLLREAQAMARLHHPHVVTVYEVGEWRGGVFMAMEVVPGGTLRTWLDQRPRSWREIVRVFGEAGEGLAAAHRADLVHRDFKPQNVLVGLDGRVAVTDFGLARPTSGADEPAFEVGGSDLLSTPLTRAGAVMGTPSYMAPEQHLGHAADERTDQFAFCVALYEALFGQRPFIAGNVQALLEAKMAGPQATEPRTRPRVPAFLRAAVLRGLRPDPNDRFPSMEALLAAMRPKPRRTWAIASGILALAICAALGWFFWLRPDPRLHTAFRLAQQHEYLEAKEWLDGYLEDHPRDGDAVVLHALLQHWNRGGMSSTAAISKGADLNPSQRAVIDGLVAMAEDIRSAQPGLRAALERDPNNPTLLYAYGESLWHDNRFAEGAETLGRSFAADPGWLMALGHLLEFELEQGRFAKAMALIERARPINQERALEGEALVLMAQDRAGEAVAKLQVALEHNPRAAKLWERLSDAAAQADDLDLAERAARRALEESPTIVDGEGGSTALGDVHLYRGEIKRYLELGAPPLFPLLHALWAGDGGFYPEAPAALSAQPRPVLLGMPPPIILGVVHLVVCSAAGQDDREFWQTTTAAPLRLLGEALERERAGDARAAAQRYEAAMAEPGSGDVRLLFAYLLARVHRQAGDIEAAGLACAEVLVPRNYMGYRAMLTPDCMLWAGEASDDPARAQRLYRELVQRWRGPHEHPAVRIARQHLQAARPAPR